MAPHTSCARSGAKGWTDRWARGVNEVLDAVPDIDCAARRPWLEAACHGRSGFAWAERPLVKRDWRHSAARFRPRCLQRVNPAAEALVELTARRLRPRASQKRLRFRATSINIRSAAPEREGHYAPATRTILWPGVGLTAHVTSPQMAAAGERAVCGAGFASSRGFAVGRIIGAVGASVRRSAYRARSRREM